MRCILLLAVTFAVPVAGAQGDVCPPLTPGSATIRCEIPIPEDTLLYLENDGVARLLVRLNGHAFKLAADPEEVARSGNAFPIPRRGPITIHVGAYLTDGPNFIELTAQGPPGSAVPRVVLANVLIEGQSVSYAVEGLVPFPDELAQLEGFPNPSRTSTTITYTVPEGRITGVPVWLAVYDALGRHIHTLVDDRRFPGTFTTKWDGTAGDGHPVADGVYVVRFVSEEVSETVLVTRLR